MSAMNGDSNRAASLKWRIIDFTENSAFMNMAIDEAVSEAVASGASLPTIRFYGWKPSAVSIGYFQSLGKEVDDANCKRAGVDIVRRRTGGGAVYHDNAGEITYSVIAPESAFPRDIIASYREICGWIIDSLAILGIKAGFRPINDIVVGNKKISGNAQTRRGGILLQHGTILHSVEVERMFSLLKVSDEKIRDKMISNAKDRVTSVKAEGGAGRDSLYRALVKGFTQGKGVEFGSLSETEISWALALEDSRYRKPEWNCMR